MIVTILEDDETLRYALSEHFKQLNYKVREFGSLEEALSFDIADGLYLVDVSLPDGLGFEYGEKVSLNENAFLIYLTVKDDQESILRGFKSGSDDYMVKPFSFEELDERIHALLRRHTPKVIEYGELRVDTSLALVTASNEELYLSVQDYRILLLLLQNIGEVVSRDALNTALNIIDGLQDGTLNVAIARLRKKLEGYVKIEAVVKQGYRISL